MISRLRTDYPVDDRRAERSEPVHPRRPDPFRPFNGERTMTGVARSANVQTRRYSEKDRDFEATIALGALKAASGVRFDRNAMSPDPARLMAPTLLALAVLAIGLRVQAASTQRPEQLGGCENFVPEDADNRTRYCHQHGRIAEQRKRANANDRTANIEAESSGSVPTQKLPDRYFLELERVPDVRARVSDCSGAAGGPHSPRLSSDARPGVTRRGSVSIKPLRGPAQNVWTSTVLR